MGQTIEAIHDGAVFRPTVPVKLKPNTRVRVTVATDEAATAPGVSFLDMASALNLEGPEDWSANVEDYLYGRLDERAARVFPGHGLRLPSGRPRVTRRIDGPLHDGNTATLRGERACMRSKYSGTSWSAISAVMNRRASTFLSVRSWSASLKCLGVWWKTPCKEICP